MLKQKLIQYLNDRYPISIRELEPIISRIHKKIPALKKYEVAIIIRTFFEVLRECVIFGYIIKINGFLPHFSILLFSKLRKNKKIYSIKIKTSTPRIF